MAESMADTVTSLEEAREAIRELEGRLNQALDILVRRDGELEVAERKILELDIRLSEKG